jgi:predicted enzyme related to lactoylglutathione lyase
MATIIRNIAFDCADPNLLASWWSQVLSQSMGPDDEPGDPEAGFDLGNGQTLYFQRVQENKAVKNRMHICLQPDVPRDAEVDRVLGLGATLVADHRESDGHGWVVLADPEGNEFCILRSTAERGY